MDAAAEIEVLRHRLAKRWEELQWYHAQHENLHAEALENARIIGMSAERELALRADVERLKGMMDEMARALGGLLDAIKYDHILDSHAAGVSFAVLTRYQAMKSQG